MSSAAVKPRLDTLCHKSVIPIIKTGSYASDFFSFDVRKVYFGSTLCTSVLVAEPQSESSGSRVDKNRYARWATS